MHLVSFIYHTQYTYFFIYKSWNWKRRHDAVIKKYQDYCVTVLLLRA